MKAKNLFWSHFPKVIILVCCSYLLFAFSIGTVFKIFYLDHYQEQLAKKSQRIKRQVTNLVINKKHEELKTECQQISNLLGVAISISTKPGLDIVNSRPDNKSSMLPNSYFSLNITDSNGASVAILKTSISTAKIERDMVFIYNRMFFFGIILVILTLSVGLLLMRRIRLPLEIITEISKKFSKGIFDQKIDLQNTPASLEMQILAQTLNNMADQIDHTIKTITLKKNEQTAILSNMGEGVLTVNEQGNIILINNKVKKYFDLNEQTNYEDSKLHNVTGLHKLFQIFQEIIEFDKDILDTEIIHNDNVLNCKTSPLLNKNHKKVGVIFVFSDLNRIRLLENHRKNFMSNISHELKTPLTAIQGYTETLLSEYNISQQTQNKFLLVIRNHTQRLKNLVDKLFILSKLEHDAVNCKKISFKKVYLRSLINEVISLHQTKSHDKNISIHNNIQVNIYTKGSSVLLHQAFSNLVENAIKFSSNNTTIHIDQQGIEKNNQKKTKVLVIDHGPGVPVDQSSKIFDRFYRVNQTELTEYESRGLGLSIVKHIANIHKADFGHEPNSPTGSKFFLALKTFS